MTIEEIGYYDDDGEWKCIFQFDELLDRYTIPDTHKLFARILDDDKDEVWNQDIEISPIEAYFLISMFEKLRRV